MKKIFFIIMIISVYIIQHIYFDNNTCFAVDGVPKLHGVPQLPGGNKLNIQPEYDGVKLDPAITNNAGANQGNIVKGIVYVINFILFFVGLIAFIFILYAGFLYLTAGSDENAHKKAITIIKNATIGIIIIVLSYAITYLLVVQLPQGKLDGGNVVNPSSGGGSGSGNRDRNFTSGPTNVITKDYTAKVLKNATGSYMYCTDNAYTNCYNMPTSFTIKYLNQTTNSEVNTLYSGVNYKILVMLNPSSGTFKKPSECKLEKDIWGIDSNNTINGDGNCALTNNNIITFTNVRFNINQNYRMKLSLKDENFYSAIQFIDVTLHSENNNYVSVQAKQTDPINYPNIYTFIPKCQGYDVDCNIVKNNYKWQIYKNNVQASVNDFEFINGTNDKSQSPQIKFKQAGEYDIRLSYYENEINGVKTRSGTASIIIQINDTFNINDIMQINLLPQFKNINNISFFDYIFNNAFANFITTPINITINALENGSNDYKYDIDFGDGTKLSYIVGQTNTNIITYNVNNKKINIKYTYKNSGTYDVKLTVTKISSGRSFDIKRQVFIGDGNNVKSVIISEIRLKYINADYIGDGSPIADANIPIYKSTNINFDASMSVGLSGIDKDLRYFWSIEENGKEVFTSTQKKINYNFKYINESNCIFPNKLDDCAKVKLRVTSTKDNFKTNEKIIYIRISRENIIPEFKTNSKLYISPANISLEVDKDFVNENEIVNYIWEIKNTNGNLYLIKNTVSPKTNLNIEFNMGDEIQPNNADFIWCKDLQGRIINIKLTVVNTYGQTGNSTNSICILPNNEEPIVISNVVNNIYLNRDKDVIFSGYAKTRNNDIYSLISKSSTVSYTNNQLIGIGEWSIVKTKEIPEVNSPIWNNTIYKCKNEAITNIESNNRYPDYCIIPIEKMSEGDYYVRFMVINVSYKKAIGPNFYGYKISKFTVNNTNKNKIKSEINIQGNSQLKYNSDDQVNLFDHIASIKLSDSTIKWFIKYEFSNYYKIYEGNNFLTESYQSTAYNPLVIKSKNDSSCTNTILADKIKISNLTTNNKVICLLSPGKYTFMLEITDINEQKYVSEKTIEIINNNQVSQTIPRPTVQQIPMTQSLGSNISARFTIKPSNNVYEGSDNAIHLKKDNVNVEFDFSRSIGNNLKYYFDADLSYDSNFDGNPSNDQDNPDELSTSFTYKYKREFGNMFRAQLKVVDNQGKTSTVIRTIKFDPQ